MIFGGQLYSFMGDSNWQVLMYTAIIPPAVGAVMIFLFVPNDYQNTRQLNEVSKQQNEKISYLNMYKGKYLWIGLGLSCSPALTLQPTRHFPTMPHTCETLWG